MMRLRPNTPAKVGTITSDQACKTLQCDPSVQLFTDTILPRWSALVPYKEILIAMIRRINKILHQLNRYFHTKIIIGTAIATASTFKLIPKATQSLIAAKCKVTTVSIRGCYNVIYDDLKAQHEANLF
jgi:hypothetical protein